jgi:RNA polymerase sigma-70 factor (sigma-E family)
MDVPLGLDDSVPPDGALSRCSGVGRPRQDYAPATVADLFRRHHLELVRLALVMVGDLATAEDVVQDCFERLHARWPRVREPERALAYARSAVLNGCRSVHRRSAVARRHAPRLAVRADAAAPDTASVTTDRLQLAAALRKLPRRQREVLVLRYYADLSVTEIAATLGISAGNASACLSRGLARLAAEIGEEER